MGLSRYLPVFVYPKAGRDKAAYFGHRMEGFQKEIRPFWVAESQTNSSGTLDAMEKAIDYIRKLGAKPRRIGAELGFLPVDAGAALRSAFSGSELIDALFVLERLRAVKSPEELKQLRIASESVIESMLAVIAHHGPGATKRELTEALRREETDGDILSLDSGGNYHGYIGDLCRMAIQGEPDGELEDLLSEIEHIQRAAMKPIKAGVSGGAVYAAAEPLVQMSRHHNHMHFLAHGMGLVSHEAPRLTATGPVPYDDYDASRPLETGMVVSVETTLQHPQRGFIKLEDTVVVTDSGFEIYGEGGRGWNRGGTAVR
jgi:Xaa-Pro aminopeptidase